MTEASTNDIILLYREARASKKPAYRTLLTELKYAVAKDVQSYQEQLPDLNTLSDWQKAALCRAFPELMFPAQGEQVISGLAKTACHSCVAIANCMTFALENSGHKQPAQYGIWGGLTERERRKIVRSRNNAQIKHDDPTVEVQDDEVA